MSVYTQLIVSIDDPWWQERVRDFAAKQMYVYEQNLGWIFWVSDSYLEQLRGASLCLVVCAPIGPYAVAIVGHTHSVNNTCGVDCSDAV